MSNEETPPTPKKPGPFNIDPVDPLVFRQNEDAPELRADPSKRSKAPSAPWPKPKKRKPEPKNYSEWTPGSQNPRAPKRAKTVRETNTPSGLTNFVRTLALLVAFLVPLLLVAATVYYASKS